jgi:hypothetical protein
MPKKTDIVLASIRNTESLRKGVLGAVDLFTKGQMSYRELNAYTHAAEVALRSKQLELIYALAGVRNPTPVDL